MLIIKLRKKKKSLHFGYEANNGNIIWGEKIKH